MKPGREEFLMTVAPADRQGSYEVSLTLTRVKHEYVGRALRLLAAVASEFDSEGLDVGEQLSVEYERDGVERWIEWVDGEGQIRDDSVREP